MTPAIFRQYKFFEGRVPDGFCADALGSLINLRFQNAEEDIEKWRGHQWRYDEPPRDHEYFEWIDLLQAVADAKDRFTMIELGAGYGRWSVVAHQACKQKSLKARLVAVEPEPTHFKWLKQHMWTNGIWWRLHTLINKPVAGTKRKALFSCGQPWQSYGQSIVKNQNEATGFEKIEMETTTLVEILKPLRRVDYIDMDIQGAELEVIEASIDKMDEKVKRVHIGTHSRDIEQGLRLIFADHGWSPGWDFPCLAETDTIYGRLAFDDGVQGWTNPRID